MTVRAEPSLGLCWLNLRLGKCVYDHKPPSTFRHDPAPTLHMYGASITAHNHMSAIIYVTSLMDPCHRHIAQVCAHNDVTGLTGAFTGCVTTARDTVLRTALRACGAVCLIPGQ